MIDGVTMSKLFLSLFSLVMLTTTINCVNVDQTQYTVSPTMPSNAEDLLKTLPYIDQNIEYVAPITIDDGFEAMVDTLAESDESGKYQNSTNQDEAFLDYIANNWQKPLYYSKKETNDQTYYYTHYGRRLLKNLFYLKAYAYEYKLLYEQAKDEPLNLNDGKTWEVWHIEPEKFENEYLFMLWNETHYFLPDSLFPASVKKQIATYVNSLSTQEKIIRIMHIRKMAFFFSPGYNSVFLKQLEEARQYFATKQNLSSQENK
jgi:hypothetical protein